MDTDKATPGDVRDRFVRFLETELIGPTDGETETLTDPPHRRYLAGTLYPRPNEELIASADDPRREQSDLDDESDPVAYDGVAESDMQPTDAPVEASTRFLPSSLGISFFTTADSIAVKFSAGRYTTVEAPPPEGAKRGERTWDRQPTMQEQLAVSGAVRDRPVLEDGRGLIDVRWRDRTGGHLVTVTLSNSARASTRKPEQMWDDLLTQVELSVELPPGTLLEYPAVASETFDEEELELRLQYREHTNYAVGHGAAPEWSRDGTSDRIRAKTVPLSLVHGTLTELSDHWQVDTLAFDSTAMADPKTSRMAICSALDSLVTAYGQWRRGLDMTSSAADRIIGRVGSTETRMGAGVEILRTDDVAWRAFQLANRAMVLQYQRGTKAYAGVRRSLTEPADLDPEAMRSPQGRPWRPFQIGFFLDILPGLVDASHPDRELVDLIWFPTGGGKTEAYLLVAAFEIFRRRLVDGEYGAGTAVLSRYTMSLLTAQQFQRAAGTILACEMIRREQEDLGSSPISIGLWVGEATTKNRFADARKVFVSTREDSEPSDVFIVDRCGWCGTEVMPRRFSEDDAAYGVRASSTHFALHCPRPDCPFHDRLPVHVVDDELYEEIPTFVLGTVDKFADLAWHERGGAFLGNSGAFAPPSLIIQDELHLLTGPLGTTVGVYEHAIELACEREGRPPKVVASTATVRRASEQVKGLFGRDVAVFPPPGIDEADSFFARRDETGPGRLYLGLMPQGHTSDTAIVHTLAALLQGPAAMALEGRERDLFWTVVAYHSSLQELGRTMTIARDDVPLRLAARFGENARQLLADDVEELTANVPRAEQPRLLERLGLTAQTDDAVSVLAATNMFSVGVDVPRLGLMLVNGQPKGTSEYIQATSRVGRAGPGLVVSVFRSARPRDRSHFETFSAYHSALYRHVEPTSVTPYSPPSQRRSLHAALVILARFGAGFRNNGDAGRAFPHGESVIRDYAERLLAVVARVDPSEVNSARATLEIFIEHWEEKAVETKLVYNDPSGLDSRLLKGFGQSGEGNATLRSMRNVDAQTSLYVRGRTYKKAGKK
ncbi:MULTISPECIES: helicase-related protein [unclassified Rathayibacter]|uniref:helicase-related protein n=1 Tax=unclassified Rathayibacter TaxID=2609250 RepID=UPI00104F1A16|nr:MULTISPECIES: helicase-related protein [unclassified Rathayibacter]TCL80082.1 helicase-like protein [Rathayibacter sp. PhB192]TCM25523.1 helicase-like protein [Rathayibacter sp. PhB179]